MHTLPRQFMAFCVSLRVLFRFLPPPFFSPFLCLALSMRLSPVARLISPSSSASRRSLFVWLPKSRQHLASSILGEIQADILSRAITVTFDHRMTGEWLTLRHQSMNFSLSARYNLQSARLRPFRQTRLARTH